ncbi:MAG: putative sporulation protein YtxC [Tepidanaerobacteraceae bacterium]|jgi:putative sporulation protein YtxC|nr:putative sporulation protein YtxC [Tepidanaerobacteraceae bacterium]
MQLLSIGIIEHVDGFEDRLKLEFDILKDEGLEITLKKSCNGDIRYYYCHADDCILLKGNYQELKSMFLHCVANAISDVIINFWESKLLKKIIKENYFYFNSNEQNRIFEFAKNILNFNETSGQKKLLYHIKRKSFVLHKIIDYLNTSSVIILDGFINFRLKDYIAQLEEAVDKAIDEYLMDKEYREFIKLLRYFVDLQEPKKDLVNVILRGGELYLFDEKMNLIEKDENMNLIARENPDVNPDDVLISTLINMAPKRIIIHGFKGIEKIEVINALYNIFEERIVFCTDCKICSELKPLKTK